MTQIVTVNVNQTVAPAPSVFQRTGALVSQGATTLAAQTTRLLTQMSDLTNVLAGAKAITSMAWSGSVVTVVTTTPHGWPTGQTFQATIAGVTPAGYNGTFPVTIVDASTFTYPLVSNPGSATVQGTVTDEDVAELVAMATTFFAQGTSVSVYVLELGAGDPAHGVTALGTYQTANPVPGAGSFYRYLVPRTWDGEATFKTLMATQTGQSASVYYHVTTTLGTYSAYSATLKSCMLWLEAPGIPSTEFSAAADFYVALNYNPSSANKVPQNTYAYLSAVTAYPTSGNSSTLATLKTANVNVVGTGAEGNISNAIVLYGRMLDGKTLNYWYSVDWVQLNLRAALAAAIISGSNNPINPLYYNQDGINRLQSTAQSTMNTAVTVGLALGPITVAAVPFSTYVALNPSDYNAGLYNGISVTFTPQQGFQSITVTVQVSNIPSS